MGLYSFFLAGSNYFAPVICGFIAQYQGWQWVFYWPAIFIAVALVFIFFFLEESNYVRDTSDHAPGTGSGSDHPDLDADQEKGSASGISEAVSPEQAAPVYKKKSYFQKMSLLGPRQPRNNMFRRSWQIVYYLSWPLIFYAGYVLHPALYPETVLTV